MSNSLFLRKLSAGTRGTFLQTAPRRPPSKSTFPRDKDRWLWGQSFYNQLRHEIEYEFPSRRSEDETGT